jgi:hypothetical protein
VSQVSKPAGRNAVAPAWKSAAQQVWKPALRNTGEFPLNTYPDYTRAGGRSETVIFEGGRRLPSGQTHLKNLADYSVLLGFGRIYSVLAGFCLWFQLSGLRFLSRHSFSDGGSVFILLFAPLPSHRGIEPSHRHIVDNQQLAKEQAVTCDGSNRHGAVTGSKPECLPRRRTKHAKKLC